MTEHTAPLSVPSGAGVEQGQRVLAVYVPESAQTNLRVGLENRTCGFKEARPEYSAVSPGDWVVLGMGFTGGSPRVASDVWALHGLRRVVVGRLTSGIRQVDGQKLWPDEGGDVWYPHRFTFEVAGGAERRSRP